MTAIITPPIAQDDGLDLALSVVAASVMPLLMLDSQLTVVAASTSFCRAFQIDPTMVCGRPLFAIGAGEWNEPRLRSLLDATAASGIRVDAYEMDLVTHDQGVRILILHASRLECADKHNIRLLLAVSDVTDARRSETLRDNSLRENAIRIQEVQHRVANSLQIIASLIMQSARNAQSEETRLHLHTAHDRVVSVAAVQQHLARSEEDSVQVGTYLTLLCESLGASMIGDHDQLQIKAQTDDSKIDADVSVSLGLMVTELVINALKHAFPTNRHGTITVRFQSIASDWTLGVTDDGIGMPAYPAVANPGLGTTIIEALARQLDARITVADALPGTTVSIAHVKLPRRVKPHDAAADSVAFGRF